MTRDITFECPGCVVELRARYDVEDDGEVFVTRVDIADPDRYDHSYGCSAKSDEKEAAALEAIAQERPA